MNRLIVFLAFSGAVTVFGQKETYRLFQEENGLALYTKWVVGKGKNVDKSALYIKTVNRTGEVLNYQFGIDIFIDMKRAESTPVCAYCIKPKKTKQGKVNGVYFLSESATVEYIKAGKVTIELIGLEVRPGDNCPKKN